MPTIPIPENTEETQHRDRLTGPNSSPQWTPYDGQALKVSDWINHQTWGMCKITLATRSGTLKAMREDEDGSFSIDLTDGKSRITHLYRYETQSTN